MASFLKLFNTKTEYDSYTANVPEMDRPVVCYCKQDGLKSFYPLIVDLVCDDEIYGTTHKCSLVSKGATCVSGTSWSIVEGNEYATIDQSGLLTILSGASYSRVVVSGKWGYASAESKECYVTYHKGGEVDVDTEVIENPDGTTTEITTTTTTNEDGTSSVSVVTVNYDESGQTDGSYVSVTSNYDENGDLTETLNEVGDSEGNVNTQEIRYDEQGNEVVAGYTIDTSNNPNGAKNYNEDGVNTEFYAFDVTQGFVLDFDFVIDFAHQPANQQENHHNILTMKRATPEPWYGFQIRQTSTNKYVILGTQFATGSNTNVQLTPAATTGTTVAEYNMRIVYDPTAATEQFRYINMATGQEEVVYSNTFPDVQELRYLKVTIGYAMDANGDPYRYSNIDVKNFSITKLKNVATPTIFCDGQEFSITCGTVGAIIYYKMNQSGSYVQYTTPVSITGDTLVQAYAEYDHERSNTATTMCYYDNGIETPVITCDGEYVTIACATTDATLYYRLNETGNYSEYTDSFAISATTVVEAFAQVGSETGHTAMETCTYSPVVLTAPVITCNGDTVTITCSTPNAVINYRLNQTGAYAEYTAPISILADTVVEAYSSYRGRVSAVVTENCEYSPVHHYENDYLTFRILTAGTVKWYSVGSGMAKTIDYSINNGSWTSITAGSSTSINVAANDVVRFRGSNASYAKDKSNYSGFGPASSAGTMGTATFNIEGNILSLIYGDNFIGQTTFSGGTYNFCSLFKLSNCISAENLVLPPTTLTSYCYRAMFSLCGNLSVAPQLPATTLSQGCYWYMFEGCAMTEAPELPALTLVRECYGNMFINCTSLNFVKCMAITGFDTSNCKQNWLKNVASNGTFVKDSSISVSTWTRGINGIPTNWLVYDDVPVVVPTIAYDGFDTITLACSTQGATIYYKLNNTGNYATYSTPLTITGDTYIQTYSELNGQESRVVSETCLYVSNVPIEASNRDLKKWTYNSQEITTPYSVNAIDGHSSSYAKGTFNFETNVAMRTAQPAYLWFQHADQSASIYVDNVLVEKHWGGYTSFFTDISNYVHTGTNVVKVALKNNEGNYLAPAAGDFNFNATLGNVRLLTSPVLPAMNYGYDGFHVTSTVSQASATIYVKTSIPTGASVVCTITGGTYSHTETKNSTGSEITFTTTITNPHLWNGTIDPFLYTITLEIYYQNELYHRFQRPYGLRFYEYVIDDTVKVGTAANPYTGFLLNGSPYLLRGVCMHDDIEGKANALTDSDYTQTFAIVQELGCNFIRLAHYPHPKEVYDWCDRLGIIVQTEGPCVNKLQSTMPSDYYTHLEGQYTDMVNQHYNHPCIMFWGLSNETQTDDKAFGKTKIEGYTTLIRNIDSERMIGYVLAQGTGVNPSGYYNNPDVDWFGCNIYVGWYASPDINNPSTELNKRIANTITALGKPVAYSEYGCGGTQHCHSDDFLNTTTRGNYERHDIEYQMWLHEGQIAAIKNYPQLLFTSEWQLFDIAVSNRNEGYTVCLDGETTMTDDNLRRLNNKGLVERDHVTKKDTFYLYKAWWNPTPFVHVCGKDYVKMSGRAIKCYTNDGNSASLYVNNSLVETVGVTNNIAVFTARNFSSGDVVRVNGATTNDTFTFE